MKIKIPEGEGCLKRNCNYYDGWDCEESGRIERCNLFRESLRYISIGNKNVLQRCPQCLNHEPVIVEYEGAKTNENL